MLGFTLLEVMIGAAIIAVLAAIAIPNYIGYRERARYNETVAEIKEMGHRIDLYAIENDKYPDTLADVNLDQRRDQWDQPYQYEPMIPDKNGKYPNSRKDKNLHPINTDYDLYSLGPDGRSGLPLTDNKSQDDIIRANDGTFIGWGRDY